MTMIDIYYTYAQIDSESFTKFVLDRYYNIPNAQICKSIHGKPYIKGDKVFFNATHSKGLLALAVGKKEVGLDCESLLGKARPAVLNKFTEREKSEILTTSDFYAHWTARESYIKFLGATLAATWRRVEYYGGRIYFIGQPAPQKILNFSHENYTFCVCGNYSRYSLKKIDFTV